MRKSSLVLLVFLLSGAAGLIYEVVWLRLLTLVFGGTTYAVSTILFSFMAGLALGAYVFAKFIDRLRSPLLAYGLLEIGVGLYSVFTPVIIEEVNNIYLNLVSADVGSQVSYALLRFALGSLVLILPTSLMGATLPVLSRYLVADMRSAGSRISILYMINTTGAVLGTLLAGFYLEATFGVQKTIYIAVAINVAIGALAVVLSQYLSKPGAAPEPMGARNAGVSEELGLKPKAILLVAGISGFCTLGYELVWFRTLKLALFNTTYAFTIMLATFLVGLSLGAYLISRHLDTKSDWVYRYGLLSVVIGLVSAVSVPLFLDFHNTFLIRFGPGLVTSFESATIYQFGLAAFAMLVPCTLMGFVLPLVNKIYAEDIRKIGKDVGHVYAVNTVGAVLGSIVVGFVLIPAIGTIRSALLLSALYVAFALYVMWVHRSVTVARRFGYASGGLVLVGMAAAYPWVEMLENRVVTLQPGADVIYFREGPSATVTVLEQGAQRAAFVDGNMVVSNTYGPLQTVRMLAHLPMLFHPDAKKIVVVGFGMGVTTYSLSNYRDVDVTVVEIAPEIIDAAPFFADINHRVYDDPSLKIVHEDGRNYLLRARERFDVITADPTHPILGSGNLYTREYYQLCQERLADNGIMVQYLPLHMLPAREFKTLLNTFASVFPHVYIWYSATDMVLMGSRRSIELDPARLESALTNAAIKNDLALSDLETSTQILSRFVMADDDVRDFVAGSTINTDDHPVVEYAGPRAIGRDTRHENLEGIVRHLSTLARHMHGRNLVSYGIEMASIEDARRNTLEGLMSEFQMNFRDAESYYSRSLRSVPDDGTTRYLLDSVTQRIRARALMGVVD